MIQTNLRDIDARQVVADLQIFMTNTLLLNAAGIIASCQAKLPFKSLHRRYRQLAFDFTPDAGSLHTHAFDHLGHLTRGVAPSLLSNFRPF